MKTIAIFIFLVTLAAAQVTEPDPFAEEPPPSTADIGTELITAFFNSEFVQHKLQKVYQLVDLKIRFIKLVKALLSRENLLMLRRILDFIVRSCNFVIDFLPAEPTTDSRGGLLDVFFPSVQVQEEPFVQRIDRQANFNFTNEEEELIEKHKDQVVEVAKLIYNTP